MTPEETTKELYNHEVRRFRGLPKYPGTNCLAYGHEIRKFVSQNAIHNMLDYGAGQGIQYNDKHKFHDVIGIPRQDIDLFDIAARAHDKLPSNIYDCVLLVDVLNYIPEDLFEYEFNRIYSRAHKVFAVVNLKPTDEHAVTRRPIEWWDEVFTSFTQPTKVIYYGSPLKDNGMRTYYGGARTG
jgi:hypothetical protein